MARVTIILEDDVEKFLRQHLHKKGDLSQLVNDACRKAYGIRKEKSN